MPADRTHSQWRHLVKWVWSTGYTTSQEATIAITYNQLARAAADNDYAATRLGDLPSVIRDLRLNADDTIRAADQRALRVVLIERGDSEEIRRAALAGEFTQHELTPEEARLEQKLTLMWLDGACTAARAMQQHPDAWQD